MDVRALTGKVYVPKSIIRSALVGDSLVASFITSKIWCAAGVADYPFMYSGMSSIIFPKQSTIEDITLPGKE